MLRQPWAGGRGGAAARDRQARPWCRDEAFAAAVRRAGASGSWSPRSARRRHGAKACPAGRWRPRDHRTLRSAPDFERVVSSVTVTDPHHPLFGRELELLSLACSRGPAFIAVALPDGRRRLLRRAATDLEQPPAPPAALPRVSTRALLPLARHIRSMLAASSEGAFHADRRQSDPSTSSAAGTISPPPAVVGHVALLGADATGTAARLPAATRPRRGGRPC